MNAIVLLHGALGSHSQLQPLGAKLVEKGRKVFLFDFSGHGGRPFSKNGFGMDAFVEDLRKFIDEEEIEQANIFGYSMGGYVALCFAHLFPHRIEKIITLGTKFDWSVASAEKETRKLNPEKIEEKVPAFAQQLQQRHTPNDWKQVLKATSEMMTSLGQKPLLDEVTLKKIKSTVLILQGDQDDMADRVFSQQAAEWLPNGKFELLPNTPHPIEKVQLEMIAEKIRQF